MTERLNPFGQPIGPELPNWRAPPRPGRHLLYGRFCRVEPLDVGRHARQLYDANALDPDGRMWTYLFSGPFAGFEEYRAWLEPRPASDDPLFFAFVDRARDQAVGMGSYLRIEPTHGVIEIGHLAFSPLMQRTPVATEAMYLMMRDAFELGYRRYEWKCDALNAASRRAAERLGFTFEGIFRQAIVYKGRNRDTAWYSIIDREWPALDAAFRAWLDPANFDAAGRQRRSLAELRGSRQDGSRQGLE
jgi:RimJ/RimL family protein N-acetyltransferase